MPRKQIPKKRKLSPGQAVRVDRRRHLHIAAAIAAALACASVGWLWLAHVAQDDFETQVADAACRDESAATTVSPENTTSRQSVLPAALQLAPPPSERPSNAAMAPRDMPASPASTASVTQSVVLDDRRAAEPRVAPPATMPAAVAFRRDSPQRPRPSTAEPVMGAISADLGRRLAEIDRELARPRSAVSGPGTTAVYIEPPGPWQVGTADLAQQRRGSAPIEALDDPFGAGAPQPLPPPSIQDVESLRGELRRALGRIDTTEQELRNTQQMMRERGSLPTENGAAPSRLSELETAFDRFQDQLSSEQSAKYPSARLTGFTQLDSYVMSQDQLNKATVGNGQNAVGFRRARLAVVGNVAAFTAYMVEVDFASAGRPSFFDVWAEQDNIPLLGAVRMGQYLQPFSVDAMSGFRHLPFLERSLPFLAFVPFRRVGVMSSINTRNERTYLAYSFFRTGGFNNSPLGDDRFATDIGDQGGLSFSTRLTHLLRYDPIAEDQYLWDIGFSYNYSRMTGDTASGSQPFYQSRTAPEFGPLGDGIDTAPATFGPASFATANLTPPNFVDTGRYLADSFNLFGVESVYQSGPLSLQGEFMATGVNSVAGPIWYTGVYGEIMYRLTGEHRGYDKRLASLKNPVPFTDFISFKPGRIHGWGAWEIAARLSYVELRNPARLVPADYIAGTNNSGNGTLTDSTVGISWWLNYHTKLQFNWIHAMLDNAAKGYSLADNFVGRMQIDF